MRVLVACEFSGVVREAFRRAGHEAVSCDLEESEIPGPHYQGDVREILGEGWDMMIAFPPCTFLSNSGARWHTGTPRQVAAVEFVRELLGAPIARIAVENPEGKLSTAIRKADQIIQPWEYGEGEIKKTGLWLKNLPLLQPTRLVWQREQRVWRMGEKKGRARERSRTYLGIAEAMAAQWGKVGVCGG